jgi:hypothetical protein
MKAPKQHQTHCRVCGDALASELRAIGAPVHALCGKPEEQERISYCLWGRADGAFTLYDADVVMNQIPLFE